VSEKFKTAAEYRAHPADACETALVRLMQAFASLKDTLRLIGGLVPRYLTPEGEPGVPTHVGTNDVDVVLDVALIDAGEGYAKLRDQLKAAGFERWQRPGAPPSSWQWVCDVRGRKVVVEFLQASDDPHEVPRLALIDGEEVSACKMPHVGIAQDWYGERQVQVEMPDGDGLLKETIRHADVVAFIVLKALACHHRNERKDAADLVHVMRYYRGGVDDVADAFVQRCETGLHRIALSEGLYALKDRFCDDDDTEGYLKTGPAQCARFHGLDEGSDDAVREQRQVSAMVSHFLDRLRIAGLEC
jgi:hypothetical protein